MGTLTEEKTLWDMWDVRVCIMGSLFLQLILISFSSCRQISRRSYVQASIWLCYLMADWVAAFAIGVITKSQTYKSISSGETEDLYAFWASFLLIHLGGPDSITSFSLEDNELWLRHLFQLLSQVAAAAYSFYLALRDRKKLMIVPTISVFCAGIIKYAERTVALYLASFDHFGSTVLPDPNPGPDYRDAVAIYTSTGSMKQAAQMTTTNTRTSKDVPNFSVDEMNASKSLDEIKLLHVAYSVFESFKGLIVGFLLSSRDRESSRNIFLHVNAIDAFRLIEYELSFMYQLLHTKVVMVRCQVGYIVRIIGFFLLIGALTSFIFVEKHDFSDSSIYLTYSLIGVAILLDVLSVVNLIFSERTLIYLKDGQIKHIPAQILELLRKKRWSGSVSQYDMVNYCLNERPKCLYQVADRLCLGGVMEKIKILWNSSSVTVTEKLQQYIFEELTKKSLSVSNLSDAKEAVLQRGEWALLRTCSYSKLKWSIGEFQYAESLLIWHLATELFCTQEKASFSKGEKRICKVISDYMFYLLVMKPTMLAPVLGNWQVVFQDTCEEANIFFDNFSISDHWQACKRIILADTKFRPVTVKGSRSKSVLFDACILAHQLQNLNQEERWKVMDLVWVELMCYAAIHCRPDVHAEQPSKGGELLTFTWLLMNHLGLGMQFYEQEQQAGKKLMPVM